MAERMRVVAMVFTDLVGSTALKTSAGDEAAIAVIQRHKAIVRALAKELGGVELDNAGDGFFLCFDAPSEAVTFGVRLQVAHHEDGAMPAVRVGVHVGQVLERTGGPKPVDLEGANVDLAARVQGLAEPGQVLMTAAAAHSARPFLRSVGARTVRWLRHGAYRFKGFEDAPLEVFEAGIDGISPMIPPAGSAKASREAPLPEPAKRDPAARFLHAVREEGTYDPARCVVRQEALAHVRNLLAGEATSALLLAPSGAGKTSFIAKLTEDPPAGWRVAPHSAVTLGARPEEIADALSTPEGGRWLVIVDGLDRHRAPEAAWQALGRIVPSLGPDRRLVVSMTVAQWDALARAGARPWPGSYRPDRGSASAAPGIALGPLGPEEMREAWRLGFGPDAPSLAALPEETVRILSQPILLRLAIDLWRAGRLPASFRSGELLLAWAGARIFSSASRTDFMAGLLDRMLEAGDRAVAVDALVEDPRLRPYMLDASAESTFRQLLDEEVLITTARSAGDLPLPPVECVEIAFESLLEYLLAWRVERRRLSLNAEVVRRFPALRGAWVRRLSWSLRAGRVDECAALSKDPSGEELVRDAWIARFSEDASEDGVGPSADALRALWEVDPEDTKRTFTGVAESLYERTRWDASFSALCAWVALPVSDHDRAVASLRISCICKSIDRWAEGLVHATAAVRLSPRGDRDRFAAALINRGSCEFDLGDRAASRASWREALRVADSAHTRVAAHNNLGIYLHYHDDPAGAEASFRDGLAACDRDVHRGYVLTNLGLVALTRSLDDPAAAQDAIGPFTDALAIFRAAGHLQGVSYAISNLGVAEAITGRSEAADAKFHETIRIGERLGERWTAYGARCNLAWLALQRGDPVTALELSRQVVADARDTDDPKGVGDAGLIAGEAAFRLQHLAAARTFFEEAESAFRSLGQRLGQALASRGLARIVPETAVIDADPWKPRDGALPPWQMLLLMEIFG